MEWVEVRGTDLEAAKEEALDQLGVALEDAEFEIVQEAESRWMGLKKTEARVRARVRPTQPRPKKEANRGRRSRSGRSGKGGDNRSNQQKGNGGGRQRSNGGRGQQKQRGERAEKADRDTSGSSKGAADETKGSGRNKKPATGQKTTDQKAVPGGDRGQQTNDTKKEPAVSEATTDEAVPMDEQQATVTEFLGGLVDAFGLSGSVSTSLDDDVIVASVDGDDLGLLIGPKGGTLRAIQELSRSALQRQASGRSTNRLRVDVAGYRERRRAALAEFTGRQATQVKEEGIELALEPMNSADRKAVHDAVIEIEGVRSISEGEEPHRRVVLLPED